MRRAAKIDANQTAIVQALRAAGARVQSLAGVGRGCPDLLVGFGGRNLLMEVKDGDKCPSARKMTPREVEWHALWHGQVAVVETPDAALRLLVESLK